MVFPHSYKNYKISSNTVYSTVFPHTIQQLQVILHTELILLQELQGSSRADQYKASSSDCSRVSKHSTRQNKAPELLYSIPRPYSISRLPVILPGRNSILGGRQHPRSPYSSSQAHSYRILPGEIGFIPKGQVLYVHAILRSVCSNLLILNSTKKINSIQSSSNSMRRYSTLSSIQVILVAIPHKIHCNGYEYTRIRS